MYQIFNLLQKLYYLDCAQSTTKLDAILSALQQFSSAIQQRIPLRFRISYAQWRKNQGKGLNEHPPFLRLHYQPPLEETPVVAANLRTLFEGNVP